MLPLGYYYDLWLSTIKEQVLKTRCFMPFIILDFFNSLFNWFFLFLSFYVIFLIPLLSIPKLKIKCKKYDSFEVTKIVIFTFFVMISFSIGYFFDVFIHIINILVIFYVLFLVPLILLNVSTKKPKADKRVIVKYNHTLIHVLTHFLPLMPPLITLYYFKSLDPLYAHESKDQDQNKDGHDETSNRRKVIKAVVAISVVLAFVWFFRRPPDSGAGGGTGNSPGEHPLYRYRN